MKPYPYHLLRVIANTPSGQIVGHWLTQTNARGLWSYWSREVGATATRAELWGLDADHVAHILEIVDLRSDLRSEVTAPVPEASSEQMVLL